jgi:hypothetical protein
MLFVANVERNLSLKVTAIYIYKNEETKIYVDFSMCEIICMLFQLKLET